MFPIGMLRVHPLALNVGLFEGSHGNLHIVGEGERYENKSTALPWRKVEELWHVKVEWTPWYSEEHQASEPWCSWLLLIQHAEGHISPCYCTTSVSTTNQVQGLVVIESYRTLGSISRPRSRKQHNSPYKYSLSWDTNYHASRHRWLSQEDKMY